MYFFVFQIPGDIETFMKNRVNKKVNLPYIVVVGQHLQTISDCYVIIQNNIYKGVDVLQCMDFVFKAFHALDTEYPPESEHIWLLIQKYIFEIETKWDKKIPRVSTLFSELKGNSVP